MKYKFPLSLIVVLILSFSALGQTATPPPSKGYLISPGDELSVKVLGEEQFGFNAAVDENGQITVPFSGTPVVAKCRTESELRGEIATLLAKYLKNPQLNLQITKRVVIPVTVAGEVNRPNGEFELRRRATLIELLASAGGVKEEAAGVVTVFRPIKPACGDVAGNWRAGTGALDVPFRSFSLSKIGQGDQESNPVIYPGDVIIVEKAPPIYITGEVVSPQGIYYKEGGVTLTQAIAKIGGFRREAKTKDIRIQRKKPGSEEIEFISVNYDLIKKQQQPDVMLKPYDIVEVDVKKDSIGVSLFKFAIGLAKTTATAASTGGGYRAVIY